MPLVRSLRLTLWPALVKVGDALIADGGAGEDEGKVPGGRTGGEGMAFEDADVLKTAEGFLDLGAAKFARADDGTALFRNGILLHPLVEGIEGGFDLQFVVTLRLAGPESRIDSHVGGFGIPVKLRVKGAEEVAQQTFGSVTDSGAKADSRHGEKYLNMLTRPAWYVRQPSKNHHNELFLACGIQSSLSESSQTSFWNYQPIQNKHYIY